MVGGVVVERFDPRSAIAVAAAVREVLARPECVDWLERRRGGMPRGISLVHRLCDAADWIGVVWDDAYLEDLHGLIMSFGDELAREIARRTGSPTWEYQFFSSSSFFVSATRWSPAGEKLESHDADDNTEIDSPEADREDFEPSVWLANRVHEPMSARLGWDRRVLGDGGGGTAPEWLEDHCKPVVQRLDDPTDPALFDGVRAKRSAE
jgi:hypothetical protein